MNWLAMPGKLLKGLAQGVLFLLAGLTAQAFAAGWLLLTCWMAFRMPGGASGWQAFAAWWGPSFHVACAGSRSLERAPAAQKAWRKKRTCIKLAA